MKYLLPFLGLLIGLSSCIEKSKPPYAIKDFSQALQPYLNKMVESGVVSGYGKIVNSCDSIISKKELIRLASSEHPILRAEALLMMANRENEDYSDIFMSHLSDTANVMDDCGEFGYSYKNVSDLLLENYKWKTEKERNKAVEEVITNHNYLSLAYKVVLDIGPDEKYYNIIREMAQRKRRYHYELDYALLSLARFKKKEDVPLIKNMMMENALFLDNLSFWLIKEFPDDSYWEVMRRFAERHYMSSSPIYYYDYYENSEEFVHFLASCKNDSAANILNYLIGEVDKKYHLNDIDAEKAKYTLYYAIWDNKCAAYAGIIPKIRSYIMEKEKKKTTFITIIKNDSPDFNSHRYLLHKKEGPFPFIKWKYNYNFN